MKRLLKNLTCGKNQSSRRHATNALGAALLLALVFITSCAGPTVEGARFRMALLAAGPPALYQIEHSEFEGSDLASIKKAQVTTPGNLILRDKLLIDVTIASRVEALGLPDVIELAFTKVGQVHWFFVFYSDPPKTLVFRRSLADIQWLSVRELEQSRLVAEVDAVPRSVRRLSFGTGPMPPPWPVTIPKELGKAFGVPDQPGEPAASIDGEDYASTADSIRKRLESLWTSDMEVLSLTSRLMPRLVGVAEVPGISWRLEVFQSWKPVAFGVPDGSIFISDGLVKALTEEELASVIAHVMGHVRHQHGRALMRKAKAMGIILLADQVASIVTYGHPGGTGAAPEILLTGGYMDTISNPALGYTPKHEIEANLAACEILRDAGISPDSLFDAFVKLGPVEPEKKKDGLYEERSMEFKNIHRLDHTTLVLGALLDTGTIGQLE